MREWDIVPEKGTYMGLDISDSSSGICIYSDGEKIVDNVGLSLSTEENLSPHRETFLRYKLKKYLARYAKHMVFDVIIIEDVFQGINPATTRVLYALNTAIDELIIDGVVSCKKFLRVENGVWKSWLSVLDPESKYKGLNDKVKVQCYLKDIGIEEFGAGYQDRLDACGMLIGYFLCRHQINEDSANHKKVSQGDICVSYQPSQDLCRLDVKEDSCDIMYIKEKNMSMDKMLDYLNRAPKYVYITDCICVPGRLRSKYDLPIIDEGGYFAFWIKRSKLKKYV